MHPKNTLSLTQRLLVAIAFFPVLQGAQYEFSSSDGDSIAVVPTGTAWLYHYNWGGVRRFKLADIDQGRARITLSARELEQDVKPAANVRAYVVVLELPPDRWYRSADIEPPELLPSLLPAVDSLGTLQGSTANSPRRITLDVPGVRRFRFLTAEDTPLVGESIPVSVYVSDYNHCGVHEGLPLGTFVTDENGWLAVPAPESPLYFDLGYWVPDGKGFAGQMYAAQHGMTIDPGTEVVRVRKSLSWATWELRLRDHLGRPMPKVTLTEWMRCRECGANYGPLGRTDAQGYLRVTLRPQSVQRLAFQDSSGAERVLSPEELATLSREKELTLNWAATGP